MLMEVMETGQPMSRTGIVVNPSERQRLDRALGRIYRLFMKLEDLNAGVDNHTINPSVAKAKYELITVSFNRYTSVLRLSHIEIPKNREQWLNLFNKYDILR